MLPKISSDIHFLPSTRVVDHYSKSSKRSTIWYQHEINYIQNIMAHTPKHFNPYTFILQKMKNSPDGFCTYLFFYSKIILIFGGLFLHRTSRVLAVNLKWSRVPSTDFSRRKYRTRRENPNSSKYSWKERKKPPKRHSKTRPFVFCTI